ncbi:patatin-like phospholipase family protein [Lysobacter korlensis]|uniref:Patatin-like phospholipase family protein n=1 Tax=Lysobacter korlensis TaxID=553636 RepID=A0ABV6RRR0_9GAMM
MKVIVVFGGGGSKGAFDYGVWSVLAPVLRSSGASLLAVGGTSMGAVNAACLARHGQDLCAGAAMLESLWCEQLTMPSVPFAGPFGDRAHRSWNGVLTGLLLGNRSLYHSTAMSWNPFASLQSTERPLMDRGPMWQWLDREVGTHCAHSHGDPVLCIPAVDVLSGDLVLFDSANMPVAPEHLAASSAMPLLFEPVEIDGHLYWDGEMSRESMVPVMLDRLRDLGRLSDADDEEVMLITIDHMSRELPRPPQSGLELVHRALELLLQGKMEVPDHALQGITHVLSIVRDPLDNDAISGQFDYSPERIQELIELGQRQAERACSGRWLDNARRPVVDTQPWMNPAAVQTDRNAGQSPGLH